MSDDEEEDGKKGRRKYRSRSRSRSRSRDKHRKTYRMDNLEEKINAIQQCLDNFQKNTSIAINREMERTVNLILAKTVPIPNVDNLTSYTDFSNQSPIGNNDIPKQTEESSKPQPWTEIRKTKGKKPNIIKQNSQSVSGNHTIDVQNMFSSLSSLIDDDEVVASQKPNEPNEFFKPKEPQKETNNQHNKKKQNLSATPIVAYNLNQKAISNSLISLNKKDFKFLRGKNPDRVVILPGSKETREAILSILDVKQINHFTYTPKEERNSTLILKNVPSDYDIEDVEEQLGSLGLADKIAKVSQPKNLSKFNFFIIHVRPGVPTGEFLKIDLLCHTKVKIEKLFRNEDPICFKCQRIGHFANGCRMGERCVKCAQNHSSNDCPISSEESRENLKCARCNQSGHPASYRGCPKLKEILDNKLRGKERAAASSVNNNNKKFASRSVNKNISFSSLLKPTNVTIPLGKKQTLNNINEILNTASADLFGCSYDQLKKSFDSFLVIYNNKKDTDDPKVCKEALLNFMLKTDYNG